MTRDEFLQEVEHLLRAPRGSANPSARLKDFAGWDSLAMIEFVALMDEKLGIDLVADEVRRAEHVSDLMVLARIPA